MHAFTRFIADFVNADFSDFNLFHNLLFATRVQA
jgi:hypothetical protein